MLHDFGDLRVVTRPTPQPMEGEALVRTVATGICGSDLHGYTGQNGRREPGQVMGHETVGEVVALGPRPHGATHPPGVGVGDIVVLNPNLSCGLCRRCLAGTPQLCQHRRVIGVDPGISAAFAQHFRAPTANLVPFAGPALGGSLVEPLAVGYHAAVRGDAGNAETVLVVGGGPIGQAVALGARRLGASTVLVSEVSPARRALVERLGFVAIDPRAEQVSDVVAGVTHGEGADVAVDAVGAGTTLTTALSAARAGARVVLVGMETPSLEVPGYEISTVERELIGSFCYTPEHFRSTAAWAERNGEILSALISRVVPLDAAPGAFAALADGSDDSSKVIVALEEPA